MHIITKGETYNITVPGNSGMETHRARVTDITRKGRGWTVHYLDDSVSFPAPHSMSLRSFEKALIAV